MRIHDKPKSQWRGRPELDLPADLLHVPKKTKRKRNVYASIVFRMKRRLRQGLGSYFYKYYGGRFSWDR